MCKVVTIWQSIWKLYCCKINKSSLWLHTSTKVGIPLHTLHEPTLCIQINLYFHKRCYLLIFIIKTVFCSCDVVKHPVLFSCNGKWFKTFWIQMAMHIFFIVFIYSHKFCQATRVSCKSVQYSCWKINWTNHKASLVEVITKVWLKGCTAG